jgi:aconitate hydratase
MINGLGVLGWGVGGIEAEANMLGQPYYLLLPEVIGFKLKGTLPEGATATDLVLTITEILRKKGVVGKFIEYFGPAFESLSVPDRATISNMSPEHGCTLSYFPVDEKTLDYLRLTGRDESQIKVIEAFLREQKLFRTKDTPDPNYTEVIELDLATVVPSLSGPNNPEERVTIPDLPQRLNQFLTEHIEKRGRGSEKIEVKLKLKNEDVVLKEGDIVIASITSCTNTSNPSVLVGAGLIAKKAVELGLSVKPYVKTSFAPGSTVVAEYLDKLGLSEYLDKLGFNVVALGCTTCIGNSGPLLAPIADAIRENDLYVSAIASGNRNFPGRLHNQVRGNFLASPMLVVAYALAGTTDINLQTDPLGTDKSGNPVYLKDLWPTSSEIQKEVNNGVSSELFKKQYATIMEGDAIWKDLDVSESLIFNWDLKSTYIRRPPYFSDFKNDSKEDFTIKGANVLVLASEKVSTDHISPAGAIAVDSPAGKYLIEHGVDPPNFNSYGSRRGNHEVMMRGTFANVRLKNVLADGKEGWWTKYIPTGEIMAIFDAAIKYKDNRIPLIVLGAKQYGQGSSRDWAAKGPLLQGVRAVIVENFERIHRSNLIGMGILPIIFENGESWSSLGLDGSESYDILNLDTIEVNKKISIVAKKTGGESVTFNATLAINAPVEIDYMKMGGILPYIVSKFLK